MQSGLHEECFAIISFFRLLQPASGWVSNLWCLAPGESGHHKRQEGGRHGDDLSDGSRVWWLWFSQSLFVSLQLIVFGIQDTSSLSRGQTTPSLAPLIREITAHTFQIAQHHLGRTEITNDLC